MKYCSTEHYNLQGENVSGRERLVSSRFPWKERKMRTIRLAKLYDKAGFEKYGDRVAVCSTWLKFRELGDKQELAQANFCHLRLCPLCTARKASAMAGKLSKIMRGVQEEHECQYFFLTLTVKNCEGKELGETLSLLTSAWNRLLQHQAVRRAVKGWFRALEITKKDKGYHPHIHAIIAVENDYFKQRNKLYITKREWVRRWRMALRADYNPSVDVRKTFSSKGGKGVVLESAKYATKDSDYINNKLTDEEAAQIVADYTKALYHRRLTAFGGWLKEMAQRLDAENLEDVDLLDGDENEIREDLAEMIEEYGWHFGAGDYVLAKRYVNPLRVKREKVENDGGE